MAKAGIIFIIVIALCSSSLGLDLEPANSLLWSGALDCEVIDGIAYCAFWDGFMVIDMNDPGQPDQLSKIWLDKMGGSAEVAVQANYAYLESGNNYLYIIDIADISNPYVENTIDCPGISGICISDGHAFVSASTAEFSGLMIYNLSDPVNPELISTLMAPIARAVFVQDHYAYIAGDYRAFYVIDIGDLHNPRIVYSYYVWGIAANIKVYDDYLYIMDPASGLYTYDIHDPENPLYLSLLVFPGARDVVRLDNYVYCALEEGGVSIIDVSDPANPVSTNSIDLPGQMEAVCLGENDLYVTAQENGIYVFSLTTPATPGPEGGYLTPWYGLESIKVSGNYAYTCSWGYGFIAIDITDPYNPVMAGHCELPIENFLLDITIEGDYAYLARPWYGLDILDISDPANPVLAGRLPLPQGARGIAVNNGMAYLTSFAVLNIVNVQDPAEPYLETSLSGFNNSFGVFISGDYLYITEDYDLAIVDISELLDPFITGTCDIYARKAYVRDNLAYVSCMNHGFSVVDISDPYDPFEISNYPSETNIYSAVVDDRFAYLSANNFSIVNIEHPEQPEFEASCNIPSMSADVRDDFVFLAAGNSIHILHVNLADIPDNNLLPASFNLSQNYPNPFNSSTIIKYNLPTESRIRLEIYDILGRQIATLEDGHKPAGYHQVIWNARDVASGMYFYRLTAGEYSESRKLLLIK